MDLIGSLLMWFKILVGFSSILRNSCQIPGDFHGKNPSNFQYGLEFLKKNPYRRLFEHPRRNSERIHRGCHISYVFQTFDIIPKESKNPKKNSLNHTHTQRISKIRGRILGKTLEILQKFLSRWQPF